MKEFEKEFNELIVETFHLILKEEMKFIKSLSDSDLSSREIHLIEGVGQNEGIMTISSTAELLEITLASVTVMVNKLESQGYINKQKDKIDGRSVRLSLTEKGREIDKLHLNFHNKMVNRIADKMTDFEKEVLKKGVQKLNAFFKTELQ